MKLTTATPADEKVLEEPLGVDLLKDVETVKDVQKVKDIENEKHEVAVEDLLDDKPETQKAGVNGSKGAKGSEAIARDKSLSPPPSPYQSRSRLPPAFKQSKL